MENFSLSDVAAVTRNAENDGWGNGAWWIIILFLFAFMGNGWGYGNNAGLTSAELQQGFDTQEITRKLDGITNGLCDGFYAQNTTMLNGFSGVTAAVNDARFAQQQCCCETNRNIDAVRYDAQKNTCDIVNAIHAEGETTRALIQTNEIQALRDKVSSLEMDNRMYGVVRYPNGYAYTAGPSPFCGCNSGCGCA